MFERVHNNFNFIFARDRSFNKSLSIQLILGSQRAYFVCTRAWNLLKNGLESSWAEIYLKWTPVKGFSNEIHNIVDISNKTS